jgi:hypothetical protein
MLFEDLVILSNNQQAEELDAGRSRGKVTCWLSKRDGSRALADASDQRPSLLFDPLHFPTRGPACAVDLHQYRRGHLQLDPRTGEENWRVPDVLRMRVVSSPLVTDRLIFGSTGSGGGGNYLVAVRPGDPPAKAYEIRNNAPYVPCALAKDDLLFLFNDRGVASCAPMSKPARSIGVNG